MLDDIGGVTSQLVKVALNASLLRQEVIANNIANANTPGFQPQRVNFENLLLNIEYERDPLMDEMLKAQLDDVNQVIKDGGVIEQSGQSKVELDMEMVEMTENVIRYRALLEGLNKRGDLIKMAISGQGSK